MIVNHNIQTSHVNFKVELFMLSKCNRSSQSQESCFSIVK